MSVPLINEILRTLAGSRAYGIDTEESDRDEIGIYVEPPEQVFSVEAQREEYRARSAPDGATSGPDDYDLVIYSLRKFLRLAVAGNPSVLVPLFAAPEHVLKSSEIGDDLRARREMFLSQGAVRRFIGYSASQHSKMFDPSTRSDLIERFGWDVKFGAHALRLAYQALDLVRDGVFTLPMDAAARDHVLAVRAGLLARVEVSADVRAMLQSVRGSLGTSCPLPESVDVAAVDAWAVAAQPSALGLGLGCRVACCAGVPESGCVEVALGLGEFTGCEGVLRVADVRVGVGDALVELGASGLDEHGGS